MQIKRGEIMRDDRRRLRLANAAFIGLLGCLSFGASQAATATVDFPQPGKDAAHTGYNDAETEISPANVASLKQKWMVSTGGAIHAQPILMGKRLYVLSTDGNLYALDAKNGEVEWSYTVNMKGAPTNWGMVADGGHVYTNCQIDYDDGTGGGHGGLCALSAKTGALDWSYAIFDDSPGNPVDSAPYGPPVLVGKTLFFGESDTASFGHVGYFQALDKSTGAMVADIGNCGDTTFNACNFISPAPPAAQGGGVFYDSGQANGPFGTTALCREPLSFSGPTWCYYATGLGSLSPTVAGGKVLFVQDGNDGGSTILALKETTGAVAWSLPTAISAQYFMPPAVAGGLVYALDGNGSGSTLYALSLANGHVQWQYDSTGAAGGLTSGVTVANGVAYAQCTGVGGNGSECAFDAQTGAILRIGGPSGATRATPVVANGFLYTVCGNNNVCALTVKK
jgi:outer membrane protein assembly factor BamB